MVARKREKSDSCIYARINAKVKERIQHAADLKGLDLTAYVVSALLADAEKTVRENEILELTVKDREVFASALLNPPAANNALLSAAKRYRKNQAT